MSRPSPTRSSPVGLPARSREHARERAPDALGDVAVDLLAVEAADVVGLEDLGRRVVGKAGQDTLPRPHARDPRDHTSGHAGRQGRREGDRRDARAQRRQDAGGDRRRHPEGVGRRDHPRRRLLDRRHRRARAQAAAARRLAPAQRRLRRQPEDVLPRGAPAQRRRRRDAAPRRPVRAGDHPQARRADRGRQGRHRARLALPRSRRRAGGRHAVVEARGQPLPHRAPRTG